MIFSNLHKILDSTMTSRAQKLATLILPFLRDDDQVLDVGSGTGHNAQAIRQHFATRSGSELSITQIDVADISTVEESPVIFDGEQLPFDDNRFSAAMMVFMLHYPENPVAVLRETARVTSGRIILIQSTYENSFAHLLLQVREFFWGRLALMVSRTIGYVKSPKVHTKKNSLAPTQLVSRNALMGFIEAAELCVVETISRPWKALGINSGLNRDIYILDKQHGIN